MTTENKINEIDKSLAVTQTELTNLAAKTDARFDGVKGDLAAHILEEDRKWAMLFKILLVIVILNLINLIDKLPLTLGVIKTIFF